MKYELLKRTAISLFICGIVAGNALAESESNSYKKFLSYDKVNSYNNTQALRGIKVGDDLANIDTEGNIKVTKANKADIDKDPFKGKGLIAAVVDNKSKIKLIAATAYNNAQVLNGFKKDDDIFELDNNGNVTKRSATADDVAKDDLEGKGLLATVIKNKDSLEDLSEDLGNLEDKVDGIVKTAANKDDLGKLNDAVVKLQEDTNEHTDILNNNSEDIAANKEAIDINKRDIETLKKSDQYRDLIKVKDLVENKADKKALELVNNDVEKNTQLIRENKASIKAKAGKDYVDLELAKKANSADVTDKLNQKVDQSTLDAYNNSLVTAIGKKADQTDVDANKVEISKKANSADVTAKLNQKVDQSTLDTYNNSLVTAIGKKADQTDVDANKVEIAKKANSSDVYTKDEANNRFVQIENNVGNNVTSISQNRANVTTNASNIALHNVRLNTLDSRVDKLDNRVNKLDKDLKRGLAAQAALSGLFQPYTVGKANFTAAVGGYKSQTAVAVGTGYRYNQNIATKAGVAFSQGGGVTYNAGVNFEW